MSYLRLPFKESDNWKDFPARTYSLCSGLGMAEGSLLCADSSKDVVSFLCESETGSYWCSSKLRGYKITKGRDVWVSVPGNWACDDEKDVVS